MWLKRKSIFKYKDKKSPKKYKYGKRHTMPTLIKRKLECPC